MKKNKIIFSIVVCTFNGSKKIHKSLESLFKQTYPKNHYEVIVVDDGSTDDTERIVVKYPVKIIKHPKNNGLAAARNSGLKIAKGEIVVCFDDDCIANNIWLENLARAYDKKHVMGAGGLVILQNNPRISDEYCFNSGYGNPAPLTYKQSSSIVVRFFDYLKTYFFDPQSGYRDGDEVLELPGILSSFLRSKLIAVEGWDESLVNIAEDIDLCRRLKLKYPNDKFVVMPSATVVHDQNLSFWGFLTKEFRRGKRRKLYYEKMHKFPPYFPGPFLYLVIMVTLLCFKVNWLWFIIPPFVLYPWWIIRAAKHINFRMVLFTYMQLLHEAATVAGMIVNL